MHDTSSSTSARNARYSTVAIILHWAIALLLIFEVGLGLNMESLKGPAQFAVFQLHKSIGITILLLVALRILWRFYRRPPAMTVTGWERALARFVHGLFYLALFALPLSGWLIVSTSRIDVPTLLYGIVPWPHLPGFADMAAKAKHGWHEAGEFIHGNLVNLLYLLFALHVAGALKHHFIDGGNDLARMAPGTRPGAWADPRLVLIGLGVVLAAGLGLQWSPVARTEPAAAESSGPPAPPEPVTEAPEPDPADAPPTPEVVSPEAATPADAKAGPAAPAKAEVATWSIASGSTLRFRTSWSGVAIEGGFRQFDGIIVFSPDHLDRSHVEIRVHTGSVFTGDTQRDDTLKSDDWFAVSRHDVATFKTDRFRKTGADSFVATGSLRMKGLTLPLSLPFTLTITGDKAVMRGSTSIDRTAYKIGEGDYAATDEIPAAVRVDVAVNATRD